MSRVNATSKEPLVDLTNEKNVNLWLTVRRILHDFGLRYRLRVQLYTSMFVCVVLGLLIYIIVKAATGTDSNALAFDVLVILFLLIVYIFVFTTIAVFYGAQGNFHCEVDKRVLYDEIVTRSFDVSDVRSSRWKFSCLETPMGCTSTTRGLHACGTCFLPRWTLLRRMTSRTQFGCLASAARRLWCKRK